ncbi:MAG TPA: endonuclease domain-containing protein [Chloroflexota bacterium]|nr:endonuclease domain-containing protein [Chloroflexota bacterium]
MGPFILDFYWREARVAIEIDGDQHAAPDAIAYDSRRTAYLNDRGITVLRFSNMDVLTHRDEVLQRIWGSLTLALSRRGGRGDSSEGAVNG